MKTLSQIFDGMQPAAVMKVMLAMTRDLNDGSDETIAALAAQANSVGAKPILVGGVAVIMHGYRRTTDDRDVLLNHREVNVLADCLMDDSDWERLEIRQYAFVYRPTAVQVDFLVSGDLMDLGRPYRFPDTGKIELSDKYVEGIQVIGLHDLFFLKLLAGRMQDLADVMELCKRHLHQVNPDRVLSRLEAEDTDLRDTFLNIVATAPKELAKERRLGQQDD